MSVEATLSLAPFNLTEADIAWVRKTRDGLSTAQKIRQLFVHVTMGDDLNNIDRLMALEPGGIHRFMGPEARPAWEATRRAVEQTEVPLFITGDLEGGGNHSSCLTAMPNQLGIAAIDDVAASERIVGVTAREARALGFNWTFTPCVDVNAKPLSAIVGTRSFGNDPTRIAAQAAAHIKAMQSHGIAATAKHWPGEGYDDRDQHLVTTVNPLSMNEWHNIFGTIYEGMINAGLLSVMSAHIALPAYMKAQGVAESLEWYRPASISKLLNMDLLRGELGFNGLIVSDATPMAGLTSYSSRAEHVPDVIESGCDMFLFATNEERDIQYMEQGLRSGALSEQRLEDAVTRILGMKAALGLHKMSIEQLIAPFEDVQRILARPDHLAIAEEASGRSVTLVKDVKSNVPLSPSRHRRITIIGRGAPGFLPGFPFKELLPFREALQKRGFEVSAFNPQDPPSPENTDAVIYVMASESSLGKTRIYLDWAAEQPGMSNLMSRYWHDLPTVLVSFGHPYYLYDAPRMPTCINAYSATPAVQKAVVERLTGNAPFTGTSPIDPFHGAPDARY